MKIHEFSAKEFAAKTEDERKAVLAGLSDEALDAALTEGKTEATALFAKEAPTVADADEVEAITLSLNEIETAQKDRVTEAQAAADRFAAAKAKFAGEPINDGVEDSEEEDAEAEAEEIEEAEDAEVETEVEADDADAEDVSTDDGDDGATVASIRAGRALPKPSAAKKVGRTAKRPAKAASNVVITASASTKSFEPGKVLDNGMSDVAKASMEVARSFPSFNPVTASRQREVSGGAPVLRKTATAAIEVKNEFTTGAKQNASAEYDTVGEAVKAHRERVEASLGKRGQAAMAAAMAWCAPSEVVYNWIADFVVDGLLSTPEINAPRGGLMLTEGPMLLQDADAYGTEAAIDAFGFGGTEAEMEAGYIKECETIVCPEFDEFRLDFDGYCWKIPILTQKTFPELIADAMRVSDVAYAHKINRRKIRDILALSTAVDATNALGGVMVDTLEAFTQVAIKERRWWNLGENATMEVKLPQEALVIFQFDMARRSGLALNDTATAQKVNAHFAAHNLAVEYLSDFDQRYGAATPTADWPETIRGIMYPVGTFLTAQDDVINLSTIYDAASLSENEYTGVFYEQGIKVIKRGYRSHVIEVPVCVAGRTGANDLTCTGFDVPAFDGSF